VWKKKEQKPASVHRGWADPGSEVRGELTDPGSVIGGEKKAHETRQAGSCGERGSGGDGGETVTGIERTRCRGGVENIMESEKTLQTG